jgi:hypothetical protein
MKGHMWVSCTFLAVALSLAAGQSSSELLSVTAAADWILSAQLESNGALAAYPDRPKLLLILPYVGNYAAMGLARAAAVTGNTTYSARCWAYLNWYGQQMDPTTGYVTDYNIANGTTPVSNGNIDSTDAYAGTFLAAVWDNFVADPNLNQLNQLLPFVKLALKAIESTQDTDGMTWAKPTYHIKYLMDNVETHGGLWAAWNIGLAVGDQALAAQALNDSTRMAAGIGTLWNEANQSYNFALGSTTDWTVLYPDVLANAFAVAWGAVPANRTALLMDKFTQYHAGWDLPNATDLFRNASGIPVPTLVGYWPLAATAFTVANMPNVASSGINNIYQQALAKGLPWPWNTGDAGQYIIALTSSTYLQQQQLPPSDLDVGDGAVDSAASVIHSWLF